MDTNRPNSQAEQLLQTAIRKIARDLVDANRRITIIERSSQSKFRSVSGGSTYYYDQDGNVRQIVGQQSDGTYTSTDVNGPPSPFAPSTPIIESRDGSVIVSWDGRMVNGSSNWPADFSHIELHMATSDDFVVGDGTEMATFPTKTAGSITLSLVANTMYWVKFVQVNTSNIRSLESEEVQFEIDPIDAGIHTFRQGTAPTGLGVSDEGAIWFDTSDGNKQRFWDGAAWVDISDEAIQEALDTAQGALEEVVSKVRLDYSATKPTGLDIYDRVLWMDPNNGFAAEYWNGSSWSAYFFGPEAFDFDPASVEYVNQEVVTSANSKNKVTYSTGVPGTTTNIAGDSWFRFDSSDQLIGQWRGLGGTSWQAVTLENAMIATMDAGKINTGFLSANRIAALTIQASMIAADAINGKTITGATVQSAATGKRVVMSEVGIVQYDIDGTTVIMSIGDKNSFTGDIDATTMQIQDQLALRGTNNIFAKGSKVALQSGQSAPNQPMSLSPGYQEVAGYGTNYLVTMGAHADAAELNPSWTSSVFNIGRHSRGSTYWDWPKITVPDGSQYSEYSPTHYTRLYYSTGEKCATIFTHWTPASNSPEGIYLYVHDDTAMNTIGTSSPTLVSWVKLNNFSWLNDYAIGRVFATTGTSNRDKIAYGFATRSADGTAWSLFGAILQPNGSGGFNTVHSMTIPAMGRLTTDESLAGINYGSSQRMGFHGSDQFVWVIHTTKWNYVYNLDGTVRLTDLEFPTAEANPYRVFTIGSISNGDFSGFRSMAFQNLNFKMRRYTDITWSGDGSGGDANAVWWVRYRWRNKLTEATMRQTAYGPPVQVVMKKRAMLSVTSPTLPPPAAGVGTTRSAPDDVWTFRYWLGKGTSEPAVTAMWLQSTQPGDLAINVGLTTNPVTSGTALNAAFTAFTGSAPAEIYSSDVDATTGLTVLSIPGDGVVRVKSLHVLDWKSLDVAWTNVANTVTVGALQYRVKAGWVAVRFIATAATASGTTYTVSTALLPTALRPSTNIRGACDFSGFPGTMVALPSGNIQVAHNSGANRAAIEGFVTWPVE